jgi:dihydroflavonol-4-reductase
MRIFVTGATGLLGNNLVRQLVASGHDVTVMARSHERVAQNLSGLKLNVVIGDMTDVAGFATALAGHEVLFHNAAYFREYFQPGDHWQRLKAINVDGTIELLRAAEEQGVRKVIYTGSGGVLGRRADGKPADEHTPPDELVYKNLYFRSKLLADERIAEFLPHSKLEVVTVMPGWMFGPGDTAPTSAGQIVLDFLNRRLPVIIPGYGVPTDARDVADGMIKAIEHGQSGRSYILGGDTGIHFRDLMRLLEEVSGVSGPRLEIPRWGAYLFAAGATFVGQLTGGKVLVTRDALDTLAAPRPNSSARAIAELGAHFRPLRETLADTVAWYRAECPDLLPAHPISDTPVVSSRS